MKHFRLHKLNLRNHQVLGDIDDLIFSSDNNKELFSYFTVFIGPNGSGKSYLLRLICEIFRDAENWKTGGASKNYTHGIYKLEYVVDNKRFMFTNKPELFGEKSELTLNEKPIPLQEIILPDRISVTSSLLNDKFVFLKDIDSRIYKYRGIRGTENTATTKTYIRRNVESLIRNLINPETKAILRKTTNYLNLEDRLEIIYYPKYKTEIYSGDLTFLKFDKFFTQWKKRRTTKPYSLSFYEKLKKDNTEEIEELIEFINKTANQFKRSKNSNRYLSYDILNSNKIVKDYQYIDNLYKLDLLYYPYIMTKKKNQEQESIDSLSSGEVNLLNYVFAIIFNLLQTNLIMIDEPENSLHPNWQMSYIDFLNDLLKVVGVKSHVLIATHSHFIISDLLPDCSSVVTLKKEYKNTKADLLPYDTYAWSAENILYNVFKVKSVRNFYIQLDLIELLGLVSNKSTDAKRIYELLEKLEKLELAKNDPLNQIILETNTYLKNLNDQTN